MPHEEGLKAFKIKDKTKLIACFQDNVLAWAQSQSEGATSKNAQDFIDEVVLIYRSKDKVVVREVLEEHLTVGFQSFLNRRKINGLIHIKLNSRGPETGEGFSSNLSKSSQNPPDGPLEGDNVHKQEEGSHVGDRQQSLSSNQPGNTGDKKTPILKLVGGSIVGWGVGVIVCLAQSVSFAGAALCSTSLLGLGIGLALTAVITYRENILGTLEDYFEAAKNYCCRLINPLMG
jgi:hypothetical protein